MDKCKNMTQCKKYIREKIKTFNPNTELNDKEILELIQNHPTKKINIENIEWVKMLPRPPYNKLALFYKYKCNDKIDDISWDLCIRNKYGNYNKDNEYRNDVKSSLRNEIHNGTKSKYFLNNAINKNGNYIGICKNCNIQTTDITTDHYPIPFKDILDTFLTSKSLVLDNIQIYENSNFELKVKDKDLCKLWTTYHDNIAKYRLLCKSCNSSFGCYN